MIQALTHAGIWVLDQDAALKFYTEKLDFEVRFDVKMDSYRWLTIGPKHQPELQIILNLAAPPVLAEEDAEMLRTLLAKGALGAGVFRTDDIHKTFEELSAKGVQFVSEPAERPYGIEAVFRDDSGNWFSLTQPKAYQPE
jgi:catechol 2,3-dioxygenase-like lactoylglutathione lyase family enzyme